MPDVAQDLVPFDPETGEMDLAMLRAAVDERTAAVFVKEPTYLGVVETHGEEIARIAHEAGALLVASVDPSTLGVLRPPADWDARAARDELTAITSVATDRETVHMSVPRV